jgi:hypothetical protein
MATVPLPERGQPLDVTYIYRLAETLNELSSQVSSIKYNFTTLDTLNDVPQNIKTSESRIIGKIVIVAPNVNVTAGQFFDFSTDLGLSFAFPPIVSVTPINVSGTQAGQDLSVIVTKVSQSSVSGKVKFNTTGQASVSLHVIAIGVPNQ